MVKRTLAVVLACALALAGCAEDPYNADADPWQDLDRALELSSAQGKQVLVVFGANWCPDCLRLEEQLMAKELGALVEREFVQMKVDVGNFDRNLDFVRAFGDPIGQGIPSRERVQPLGM